MTTERKGDWFQTAYGVRFFPLDPRPEDIDIRDIAHALSNACRFNGHCKTHYSVAQHCVLVAYNCPQWPLHGLLHDAAEAYLVDLPRPVKISLRQMGITIFDEIEANLMRVISKRFLLCWGSEAEAEVKYADDLLLVTEARDLMAPLIDGWRHRPENGFPIMPKRISPWTPWRSEMEFMDTFRRLGGQG